MSIVENKPVHWLAVVSLLSSLSGLLFIGHILGMIGLPLLGIITGHIVKAEIREYPQVWSGEGLANTGLLIGYIVLGVMILIAMVAVWIFKGF